MSEHVRNIAVCLILSIVSCGIYNVYWQHVQMQSVNEMLHEERYSFWRWFLLSLVTCGIYHIYHEYRLSTDIASALKREPGNEALIAILLSLFGLSFVVDAIQQSQINEYFGSTAL
jgi:Domain of unknown function (DUF4234)